MGGAVVFPDLRLIIEMEPGDLLLFPDHLINYHFEPVTGRRHSLITCVHENMSKFWEKSFGFISPLNWHHGLSTRKSGSKKKKNRGARKHGEQFKQGKAAVKKESGEHRVVVKKESAKHRVVVKKESAKHRVVPVKKEN
jgi:hypothetical protein